MDYENGYPVLYDSQIFGTSTGAVYQPGAIFVRRFGTGRMNWSMVKYIKLDNTGCNQGEALVTDFATLNSHIVTKAATADFGVNPRGIAAATIASNSYGFMVIGGLCGSADLSHTAASGEYLQISGSTAGKLTPNLASVYNAGTQGNASMFIPFAVAREAIATGFGSIQILGVWG